jgi:hypothetical protein
MWSLGAVVLNLEVLERRLVAFPWRSWRWGLGYFRVKAGAERE